MRKGMLGMAVIGILLTGCGDDGDDDASSSGSGSGSASGSGSGVESSGGDELTTELEDGSTLTVRLDVDPSDPAVAPYEELRVAAGGPEVTWIVGEIEVPDGVDGSGRFLTFLEDGADPLDDDPLDDTDGITNAEFACAVIDDWANAADDLEDVFDLYNELYEGPCGGQTLQVLAPGGETTTYVMVYEGPLPAYETIQAGLGNVLE